MTKLPNILRTIAADSSIAFFLNILAVPIGYISNVVMARLFGAEQMGTYFIALNLVVIITTFCRFGMDVGLLRFVAGLKAEGETGGIKQLFLPATVITFLIGSTAAAIIFRCGDWLSQSFHAPGLLAILGIMCLTLPVYTISSLGYETVRALGRTKSAIFQQTFLSTAGFLTFLIIFAYASNKLGLRSKEIGLAFFMSTLISFLFLCICLMGMTSKKESKASRASITDLIRYSFPLFLLSIFWLAFGTIDSLILGWFTSPKEVALYRVATKTAPLVAFPLLAVNAVVPPLFAQFHQSGRIEDLEAVARSTARWMYFISLPLAIIIILLAPEILSFFGPEFIRARYALILITLAQLANVTAGSVGFILSMTGKQWALIRVTFAVAVIVVPLMALGAATFGLNGLAGASALGLTGINLFMVLAVWRHLKIKAFAQGIRRVSINGIIGIVLFYLTKPYVGAFGGAAFFSLSYLVLGAKIFKKELSAFSKIQNLHLGEPMI